MEGPQEMQARLRLITSCPISCRDRLWTRPASRAAKREWRCAADGFKGTANGQTRFGQRRIAFIFFCRAAPLSVSHRACTVRPGARFAGRRGWGGGSGWISRKGAEEQRIPRSTCLCV